MYHPKYSWHHDLLVSIINDKDYQIELSKHGPAPVALLQRCIKVIGPGDHWKDGLKFTQSLIELATEKIYAHPYKDVPKCWRTLYLDATLLQIIMRQSLNQMTGIIEMIDKALIMVGDEGREHIVKAIIDWLEFVFPKEEPCLPTTFETEEPEISLDNPIPRMEAPSLEAFQKHMNENHTPLVLTNVISNWKALKDWSSPRYLLHRTINGLRLVPIELGESYVSDTWTQNIIRFSTFLHEHVFNPSTPRGYLAQHNLLRQIPSLRKDRTIPDYCYTMPPENPPDEPKVAYVAPNDVLENIWMGPEGTRSPLHNDPYENIFAQVVGYKYFRLYPPKHTENLYPRGIEGGIQMGNTSQVDVEKPDLEKFPLFADAEYVDAVIGPRECLYIPRGWWHFVRSESISIGISFWW